MGRTHFAHLQTTKTARPDPDDHCNELATLTGFKIHFNISHSRVIVL